jgi:mRNA interferase MazF
MKGKPHAKGDVFPLTLGTGSNSWNRFSSTPPRFMSKNRFNKLLKAILVLATARRDLTPLFSITEARLPKQSWIKISLISRLSVKRIGNYLAHASEEGLVLIIEGLNEIIGG